MDDPGQLVWTGQRAELGVALLASGGQGSFVEIAEVADYLEEKFRGKVLEGAHCCYSFLE